MYQYGFDRNKDIHPYSDFPKQSDNNCDISNPLVVQSLIDLYPNQPGCMDTVPKYLRCRRPFRKQAVSKLATLQMPTTGEPGTAGVYYADLTEDIIGRTLPLAK